MLNVTKHQILTKWRKFLIKNPQAIIPSLAIATSVVFYIVVVNFENYNWYHAIAYVQCFIKINNNAFIQINDGTQLQCSSVLQQPEYWSALTKIIMLIIKTICALIFTTLFILVVFLLINKIIQRINQFNNKMY